MNNFRSQHEAILHLCGECEYTETKHEGVHYKCKKCDYQTKRKQSLNQHIKSIHVAEGEVV